MELLGAGAVVAQRYTVVSVLGQGGMAVVYEVMNHTLGTPCALKVLTLSARSVQARLTREGQVQASLAHPNVVSVFDVIDVDGSPGLLMELVRGPALDVLLAQQRLTFDQCDALARGIFAGMAAAHERGLIHRDLKPANILCSVANGTLIPKIADFGLAKIVSDESGANNHSNTRSGTTMGTPSYMAPEQIRNAGKVDRRADLFSLGAILYEMVCGRKAFEGDDLLELFTNVAAGRFTPPRELRPDLPDRMERAIVGALTPDREARIRDVPTLASVWNGDRDEWTSEVDPSAATRSAGPWDATLLSRYKVTGSSGERSGSSGGGLTPMSPSARGPTSGATYTEDQAVAPPEPVAAAVRESSSPSLVGRRTGSVLVVVSMLGIVGAAAVAVAVVLVLVVGRGVGPSLDLWGRGEPPAPPPVPAPPGGPPPAPVTPPPPIAAEPVPGPVSGPVIGAPEAPPQPIPAPPRGAPEPPKPAPAAPLPAPTAATAAPAPPAPAPEPTPTAQPSNLVRVDLKGDARQVMLAGTDGNHRLPASLPPGTYTIQAFFPGSDDAVETGRITLELGRDRVLSCHSAMRNCK